MKHPSKPDTQPDEYLPDRPAAHRTPPTPKGGRTSDPSSGGINPIDTDTMPRAEDDARTLNQSIEYNDRADAPPRPDRPRRDR